MDTSEQDILDEKKDKLDAKRRARFALSFGFGGDILLKVFEIIFVSIVFITSFYALIRIFYFDSDHLFKDKVEKILQTIQTNWIPFTLVPFLLLYRVLSMKIIQLIGIKGLNFKTQPAEDKEEQGVLQ